MGLRKLGGNRVQQGERKRGWGASGARLGSGDGVAISSNTLKDLVPDPKNLLEKPDVDPVSVAFTAAGGLVLIAGTATATIPTAALLAGKAIVIKGLLLNQLLAEQAA